MKRKYRVFMVNIETREDWLVAETDNIESAKIEANNSFEKLSKREQNKNDMEIRFNEQKDEDNGTVFAYDFVKDWRFRNE